MVSVFQQDNAPKHTSIVCRSYLQRKEADDVLENMTWPPQSQNLNPIELRGEDLGRKIRTYCPTSAGDLWEKLREAWASLEQAILDKLVETMPLLVRAAIESKGGFLMKNI